MNKQILNQWKKYNLDSLGTTYNGLTGKTSKDFGTGDYYITPLQVFNNHCNDLYHFGKVKILENEIQNKVKFGDILLTTSSETPEEVGIASVFLEKELQPYLNSFCFGFRLDNFEISDPKFIFYYFTSDDFRKSILPLAQGSTRYNLSKNSFLKLNIKIPLLVEQKKITFVLASVDEVINNIQILINKLQDLKKAIISDLLTKGINNTEFKDSEVGKVPKNWKVLKISKLAKIKTGKKNTQDKIEGEKYPFFVRSQKVERINKYSFDEEAVITVGDGVGTGKVFHYINGKFELHQRVYKISNFSRILNGKFFYYFFSQNFIKQVNKFSAKGSVDSVRLDMISEMKIPVPKIEEQQKIAFIISSLEKKISLYSQKLYKIKILKKSLIEDLITGKIRIPVK